MTSNLHKKEDDPAITASEDEKLSVNDGDGADVPGNAEEK